MFTDADYPALPYPGARPPFACAHDHGRGHPLTHDPTTLSGWRLAGTDLDEWLRARAAAPLADRVPLLSYGSNACPAKLTWLRDTKGLRGPVVCLPVTCRNISAVWAAGLRVVDGQRPAVLAALPGTTETHTLTMITPDQLTAFDTCEARGDRHHLARVHTGHVTLTTGGVIESPLAYVGAIPSRRPLLVNGKPVPCTAVPQERTAHLTGVTAPHDGLDTTIVTGTPSPHSHPDLLFVYGTLQPGATAWPLLAPLCTGTPRRAHLPGTLFDTGQGYPALRLGEGPGVPGWVIRVTGPMTTVDEYEGPEYERVRVTLPDGTVCWTYVWTDPMDHLTAMTTPWPSHAPTD